MYTNWKDALGITGSLILGGIVGAGGTILGVSEKNRKAYGVFTPCLKSQCDLNGGISSSEELKINQGLKHKKNMKDSKKSDLYEELIHIDGYEEAFHQNSGGMIPCNQNDGGGIVPYDQNDTLIVPYNQNDGSIVPYNQARRDISLYNDQEDELFIEYLTAFAEDVEDNFRHLRIYKYGDYFTCICRKGSKIISLIEKFEYGNINQRFEDDPYQTICELVNDVVRIVDRETPRILGTGLMFVYGMMECAKGKNSQLDYWAEKVQQNIRNMMFRNNLLSIGNRYGPLSLKYEQIKQKKLLALKCEPAE